MFSSVSPAVLARWVERRTSVALPAHVDNRRRSPAFRSSGKTWQFDCPAWLSYKSGICFHSNLHHPYITHFLSATICQLSAGFFFGGHDCCQSLECSIKIKILPEAKSILITHKFYLPKGVVASSPLDRCQYRKKRCNLPS